MIEAQERDFARGNRVIEAYGLDWRAKTRVIESH